MSKFVTISKDFHFSFAFNELCRAFLFTLLMTKWSTWLFLGYFGNKTCFQKMHNAKLCTLQQFPYLMPQNDPAYLTRDFRVHTCHKEGSISIL